VEEVFACKVL